MGISIEDAKEYKRNAVEILRKNSQYATAKATETAFDALITHIGEYESDEGVYTESVEKECPTFKNKADVVEVVRCKDCIHYKDKGVLNEFDKPLGVCKKDVCFWDDEPIEVLFDDFCSYGERKDT